MRADVQIRISLRQEALLRAANRLSQLQHDDAYPRTAKAVQELTREAQRLMLKAVQGNRVSWSGGSFTINRIEGRLAGSILGGYRYPLGGDRLAGGVEVKIAYYKYIRDGIRPYDMKPGLLASPKAKTSKNGIRYLVIPMREEPHRWSRRVFRIVTSRSKGWIHPGMAPRPLDKYVNEAMRKRAAAKLRRALKADMEL